MTALVWVLALLLGSGLSACIFNPGSDGDSAEINWRTDAYEFEQRFLCFCVEPAGRFQRILVRNDSIISVTDIVSGEPLAADKYGFFKTVPQLFAFANSVDPDSVAELRVSYDDVYGYPTEVYIDYDARRADEERGFESRNLRILR